MQQDHKKGLETKAILIPNEVLIPEIVRLINEGHTVTLPLRGFSMRPFLEDGRDKALLAKPVKPRIGDPVLAETAPKHYVLHRIVEIDNRDITLLGDGNLTPEHCTVDDILASVTGFYRKGRASLDRTDGRKWKTYSCIWMGLRPMRRWLLAFYRRIYIPLFGTI